jgi:hypothetical protein
LQVDTQRPIEQATDALAERGQALPQAPQWAKSA